MQVDKEEEKIIRQALDEWTASGILTNEQADIARQTLASKATERQQLAQYFFIIAVSSALLAFGALFIDEKLLEHLRRSLLLSNWTIAGAGTLLSIMCYWYTTRRRSSLLETTYEVYQIPGILATLVTLVYLCKEIGNGASYTILTGLSAITFFILSLLFRSKVIWLSFIIAIMGWFGTFSTVFSHDNLFLGMNYPLRFTVFGLFILALCSVQKQIQTLKQMANLSYHAGLIIFFTGIWGVSVFGNFGSLDSWQAVRQTSMMPYAVTTGIVSALALYIGIHRKDETLRDYSILFLLLHLYTRYFEYFWNATNKGLFFLVLAVSFGLLARWLSHTKRDSITKV